MHPLLSLKEIQTAGFKRLPDRPNQQPPKLFKPIPSTLPRNTASKATAKHLKIPLEKGPLRLEEVEVQVKI